MNNLDAIISKWFNIGKYYTRWNKDDQLQLEALDFYDRIKVIAAFFNGRDERYKEKKVLDSITYL